jgi:DNA polymerase I-like protein with 3'-5' exonuclease and polymerase domains/uracil-DNA glycosylase
MLPKPPACQGCPLYGDGWGFVPDHHVPGASVLIVAQNPGADEESGQFRVGDTSVPYTPAPLIGKTGSDLFQHFAPLAKLTRETVSLGNILKCRWQGHCEARCNHLPSGKMLEQAVTHCRQAHFRVPPSTRLIVAMGALAWDTLTGGRVGPISRWRGFLAPDTEPPVYGTLHIADLYRNPIMRLPTQLDWAKIPRILAGEWPRAIPPYVVATESQWNDVAAWFDAAHRAEFVCLDTEYDPDSRYLDILGLRAHGVESSLLFQWRASHTPSFWGRYLGQLRALLARVPVVFQNALADVRVLAENIGLQWRDYARVEDTMLAHACLYSEFPHDLEFLASLFGQYPKLKHLAATDPLLYNHGDLLATEDAWLYLRERLAQDTRTARVYRSFVIPLVPIYVRASRNGVRVDRERARQALAQLEAIQAEASRLAMAWCGRPINVGSSVQVLSHLATHDGIRLKNCQMETISDALRRHPDNLLLQARRRWTEAEGFRKYAAALAEVDEVHPEFLPTQATGRTSVTNPPLVNFPDDGKAAKRGLPPLQSILLPHPGHWWLCWDWSALHARFMAAVSGDTEDLDAFAKGYDLHLITACRVFQLPLPPNLTSPDHPDNEEWRERVQWQPKDRRRHLVKTVRYALLNGLDHRAVREAKEVVEQGLDMRELEQVAQAFLRAKPAMTAWKRSYAAAALRAGEARSLYGRRRQLLATGPDERSREERAKAAISGFLQMTEADILAETLIEVCRRYPDAVLVFPSHDGVKLEFPNERNPREVYEDVAPWVQREHDFWGYRIACPAEWTIVREDGTREHLV